MSITYEVWSITSGNAYAQTFTDLPAAEHVLRLARWTWPDDEFTIVGYDEQGNIVDADAAQTTTAPESCPKDRDPIPDTGGGCL